MAKQEGLAYNPARPPTITSIFDFSADALSQLASWFAQHVPSSIPIAQLQGYGQLLTASRTVTGRIPAAGTTPTAGTEFTYTHTNGTGVYVFTFTTAFAATPVIVCQMGPRTATTAIADLTAESASGFTVTTLNSSTGAAGDFPFNFIAATVA